MKPLLAEVIMACACGGELIRINGTKPDCHAELTLKKCSRCGSTCCAVLSIYGNAVSWDYQDHMVAQSWFNSLTPNRADELYRSVTALHGACQELVTLLAKVLVSRCGFQSLWLYLFSLMKRYAMKRPLDTLQGSVDSQVDIVAFKNENDWEALGNSPRYTLDELLHQCDPAAPEADDIIAWQNLKKVGREE